jgi:hypothetical protein
MRRFGALTAIVVAVLAGLSGCPAATLSSGPTMVTISGTLHAQGIGGIGSDPVIQLVKSGSVKYTLSASYSYDSELQILDGTLSSQSVISDTYDVVVAVDSASNPYGSSCSITVNGVLLDVVIDVSGGPDAYVVTIPGIAVQADANVAIVLNNLS